MLEPHLRMPLWSALRHLYTVSVVDTLTFILRRHMYRCIYSFHVGDNKPSQKIHLLMTPLMRHDAPDAPCMFRHCLDIFRVISQITHKKATTHTKKTNKTQYLTLAGPCIIIQFITGQTTTNDAAATTFQGKTRGC